MTRYINPSKYWHESCKTKALNSFSPPPHPSLCSGWWWTLREFSAILSLRATDSKSTSLKYCRLTCNGADGATHRSYPHMGLQIPCRQGLKVCTFSHALPVEVWRYLCEDCSNMQLNQPIQLLPTLRLCEIPCKRFSLATIATMHQWHLFPPHAPHIFL